MLSVTKILQGHCENIVLILGKEDNTSCFYYLQVDSALKQLLSQLSASYTLDIAKFGTVLERGHGEPSEFDQIQMRDRYDFVPAEA